MPYPIVRPARKSFYSQTHCASISQFSHALKPHRDTAVDHFLWASQQLSMVAVAVLPPTSAGCVISLLLILPSSKLPGTRGQKLHMGNNLTNHLSGSPARTPTLKLTQLLLLGLQPRGMSAEQQVPEPRGPRTLQLHPAEENQGAMFEKG